MLQCSITQQSIHQGIILQYPFSGTSSFLQSDIFNISKLSITSSSTVLSHKTLIFKKTSIIQDVSFIRVHEFTYRHEFSPTMAIDTVFGEFVFEYYIDQNKNKKVITCTQNRLIYWLKWFHCFRCLDNIPFFSLFLWLSWLWILTVNFAVGSLIGSIGIKYNDKYSNCRGKIPDGHMSTF